MRKKSKRGKQRVAGAPQPSSIVFTFAVVRILKDALHLVDKVLACNTQPLPNLEFGLETLENLKRKLDDMLQFQDWDKETPFDYNELHILYAAVHIYLFKLTMAENQQLIPLCVQLCKQFGVLIEAVPPKQLNTSEGSS